MQNSRRYNRFNLSFWSTVIGPHGRLAVSVENISGSGARLSFDHLAMTAMCGERCILKLPDGKTVPFDVVWRDAFKCGAAFRSTDQAQARLDGWLRAHHPEAEEFATDFVPPSAQVRRAG